jgi:hypothetical protein
VAQHVREKIVCLIGLILGIYLFLIFFHQRAVPNLLANNLKYSGYLVIIGTILNLAAPSKIWPSVLTSLPLTGATIFICIGSIIESAPMPSHIAFGAVSFFLSSLVSTLFSLSLSKLLNYAIGWRVR